jgi:hypothetical protein
MYKTSFSILNGLVSLNRIHNTSRLVAASISLTYILESLSHSSALPSVKITCSMFCLARSMYFSYVELVSQYPIYGPQSCTGRTKKRYPSLRMYPGMANVVSFDIMMWPRRVKPEKRRYDTTPTPWIRRLRSRHSVFTSTNRYHILHALRIDII